MNASHLRRVAQKFVIDNSPTLLTTIGVVGTVSTAVLTGRASYKAYVVLDEAKKIAWEGYEELPPREKVRLTWQLFLPAVGTGSLTVACILGANRISASRAAGLAAAYSLTEQLAEEYRLKVIEKIGPRQEQVVRDEVVQARVENNPPSREVVILAQDDICCDVWSGRYFKSSIESIKKAMNDLNYEINSSGYASLSDFYEKLGLASTQDSEEIGWTSEMLLDLEFTTALSPNGRPCLAFLFRTRPIRNYYRQR